PGMPMFQPVLSHKIACLGRSQARLLESWGNQGRCEVVGAPRLDGFIGRRPRTRMPGAPAIVLVATAQTPGFTERQVAAVVAALTDVRRAVAARDPSSVQTRWRVAKVIEAQMELISEECDLPWTPLEDSLAHADAVISTPSTLLLEAMLTGLPTALLDYTNSPQYVPSAWSITRAEHVQEALDGLLYPPPERRLLQDFLLHDSLECCTPAAPRAAELLRRMAELGRQARAEEIPLAFPARMLVETLEWHLAGSHDLKALFPGHAVFAESDTARLQAELGHVRTRNLELAAEVERLRK